MTSDKAKTNKKWTSTDEYRARFDSVFNKKESGMKYQYGDQVWVSTAFYNWVPATVIGFRYDTDGAKAEVKVKYEVQLPHQGVRGYGEDFEESELESRPPAPLPLHP